MLAFFLLIQMSAAQSTYDILVSEQLRPFQRGSYSKSVVHRPEAHPRPRYDTQGRLLGFGIDSSKYSNSTSQFEGIYAEGEQNMTAQANYDSNLNQIKPHIAIGGIKAGINIEYGNTRESTLSYGGHPAENKSSSSQSLSFQPVINGHALRKINVPINLVNGLGLGGLLKGGSNPLKGIFGGGASNTGGGGGYYPPRPSFALPQWPPHIPIFSRPPRYPTAPRPCRGFFCRFRG